MLGCLLPPWRCLLPPWRCLLPPWHLGATKGELLVGRSLYLAVHVTCMPSPLQELKGELLVGGVYVRLFLKDPRFPLR